MGRPANIWLYVSVALFLALLYTHVGNREVLYPNFQNVAADRIAGDLNGNHSPLGSLPELAPKRAPLNVHQRMDRSEAIFQNSLRQREDALKWFPDKENLAFFPTVDHASYFKHGISIWDLFTVSYTCPWDLQRVGRIGDGGKWVCGMTKYVESTKPFIVYSMGVRDESTFEEELLQRTNCQLFAYDPAVDKMGPQVTPEMLKRVKFTQAAVGGTTNAQASPPTYSLKDMMKQNGHDYIDILKIDIEYYEFEVMDKFIDEFNGDIPIGQFMVEIHLFNYGQTITNGNKLRAWWEKLEAAGLRATMTEPNLLYVTLKMEDAMPRLAEYTFINHRDSRSMLRHE